MVTSMIWRARFGTSSDIAGPGALFFRPPMNQADRVRQVSLKIETMAGGPDSIG